MPERFGDITGGWYKVRESNVEVTYGKEPVRVMDGFGEKRADIHGRVHHPDQSHASTQVIPNWGYHIAYIGSCCFSRGLILAQAMLQIANIVLEMETPCALHALSIALVSFSSKEVVGTTVWRTGSLLRGKACPPYNIDR